MAYDKKHFLDLLLEYRSDEAKKARRNVSVIAFVIISAWCLNLHLSSMSVLGMNVSGASEIPVLAITFVLLVYWFGMFLLAWLQDSEIQKERSLILDEQVTSLLNRLEVIEKAKKELPSFWSIQHPDHSEVQASVGAYKLQQQRTKRALLAVTWMRRMEFYVPLVLTGAAMLVLLKMAYDAL
jgi:hypothetical protein